MEWMVQIAIRVRSASVCQRRNCGDGRCYCLGTPVSLGYDLAYLSWLCYISDVLDSECYSESQLYLYG